MVNCYLVNVFNIKMRGARGAGGTTGSGVGSFPLLHLILSYYVEGCMALRMRDHMNSFSCALGCLPTGRVAQKQRRWRVRRAAAGGERRAGERASMPPMLAPVACGQGWLEPAV